MPKKIKLTPEQREREAAIAEIEGILNESDKPNDIKFVKSEVQSASRIKNVEAAPRPKRKGKVIVVKNESGRSPYLLDLQFAQASGRADKDTRSPWAADFDVKKPESSWKKLAENFRASLKNITAQKKRLKIKNKALAPAAASWRGLQDKAAKFYKKHREVLDELLVFNALMAAALVIKRILRIIFTFFLIIKNLIKLIFKGLIISFIFIFGQLKNLGKVLLNISKNFFKNIKLFGRRKARRAVEQGWEAAGIVSDTSKDFSRRIKRKGRSFVSAASLFILAVINAAKMILKIIFAPFIFFIDLIARGMMKAEETGYAAARGLKQGGKKSGVKIFNFTVDIIRSLITHLREFFYSANKMAQGLKDSGLAASAEVGKKADSAFSRSINFFKSLILFKFLPPHSWQRQLAVFMFLAFAIIAPLKFFGYLKALNDARGKVLGESVEAVDSLRLAAVAGGEFNFAGAAGHFAGAADNFDRAKNELRQYSELIKLADMLPSKKTKVAAAGQLIIESGEIAARAGEFLSLALESLQLAPLAGVAAANNEELPPLTSRLKDFSDYNKKALFELDRLEEKMGQINIEAVSSVDFSFQEKVVRQLTELKDSLPLFKQGLAELAAVVDILPALLGDEIDARYLLIFQNNAEMRASGGFIGSFALIDFRQGEIKNIEVPGGGSYDLQGGLHTRIAAPKPLHLINSLWEFQDSNWWPDWPMSAKKIAWFFEHGWGSSVDGVIAVDPTFVESLLAIIGPIDLTEKYGEIITPENFYQVVQAESERKDTNTPKMIVKDLADKIIEELPARITKENFFTAAAAVGEALKEKHILFNFNDQSLQEFVQARNWDGRILDSSRNYLAVINTNIAGGKSDRKMEQEVDHLAEITPDGTIINTLRITRRHTAVKNEPFVGVRNVNYLRVYVPQGSELLEAWGFDEPDKIFFDDPADGAVVDPNIHLTENIAQTDELSGVKIYDEFNKTVFANWTMVDPGQEIIIYLKYKLPFKINSIKEDKNFVSLVARGDQIINPYTMLIQKQSGSITSDFTSKLILPANMEIIWKTDGVRTDETGWLVKDDLRVDKLWGVIVAR